MKKLTAVLLALVLAAALCVGAMAESAVNYVDTWVLTGISMAGMDLSPESLGMDMFIVLNEDGTCLLSAMGEEETGTWAETETGITTTDGSGIVDAYTLTDGKLSAEVDGMVITFTRKGEIVPAGEPAAEATVLANLTLADFDGHWKLTGLRTMGTILPPALGGIELDLTIENGKCLYDSVTAAGKGAVELLLELEEVADLGTQVTGYVQDASGNKADVVLTLVAMSDGTLIWDASTPEMEMVFILELQTEEAAQ